MYAPAIPKSKIQVVTKSGSCLVPVVSLLSLRSLAGAVEEQAFFICLPGFLSGSFSQKKNNREMDLEQDSQMPYSRTLQGAMTHDRQPDPAAIFNRGTWRNQFRRLADSTFCLRLNQIRPLNGHSYRDG